MMTDKKVPAICRDVQEMQTQIDGWKKQNCSVGLVATMGALHDGHLSLVHQLAGEADRILVSIFVNQKQFAENEDFAIYPRQLEEDAEKLATTPADLIYAPDMDAIYPPDFATKIIPAGVAGELEGKLRPQLFAGVAVIVTKLFLQSRADMAIFGEKDYQQILVIRQLVRDLDIPIKIFTAPIRREADGLAMSSRNRYLTPEQRYIAGQLNIILQQSCQQAGVGENLQDIVKQGKAAILEAGFDAVDYLSFRHPVSFAEYASGVAPPDIALRLLVAARLGSTRLLDNMPVSKPAG